MSAGVDHQQQMLVAQGWREQDSVHPRPCKHLTRLLGHCSSPVEGGDGDLVREVEGSAECQPWWF